jgi:hypothetical protein
MARGWTCPRCSTKNGEGVMNCSKCGLIQGAVFVASTYVPPAETEPTAALGATEAPEPASDTYAPTPWPAAEPSLAPPDAFDAQPSAGWVPPYPIAAPAARPLWRRIPLRLLLFGALLIGGAIAGFITNASRSSTGDITKSGDLTSSDLRVGDCWDLKDPSVDQIDNVTARPCGEAHQYEVFSIPTMGAGDYPAEAAFTDYVSATCVPEFETFVGTAYDASTLDIFWLYPSSEGWAAGDHAIACSVFDPASDRVTSSLRGSRR